MKRCNPNPRRLLPQLFFLSILGMLAVQLSFILDGKWRLMQAQISEYRWFNITKLEPPYSSRHIARIRERLEAVKDVNHTASSGDRISVVEDLLSDYPLSVDVHRAAGELYFELGNYVGSGHHFSYAARLDPSDASLRRSAMSTNERAGNYYASAPWRRIAWLHDRTSFDAMRDYWITMQYSNRWDDWQEVTREMRAVLARGKKFYFHPFHMVTFPDITAVEVRKGIEFWSSGMTEKHPLPQLKASPSDRDRRIRVGFLSQDFYSHPVGAAFKDLPQRFDKTQFDIVCLNAGEVKQGDSFQIALRENCPTFIDFNSSFSHKERAIFIRNLSIDVLFEMGLWTGTSVRIMTYNPAPVQIGFLGKTS